MNNKGFTLIELIATILLLAIISLISFVSINKVVEQNKINNCHTIVDNIKTAANEYVSDNRYNSSFIENVPDSKIIQINAQVLTEGNYLSAPIVNPFDKTEISANSVIINIELNDNYTSKSIEIISPDILLNCNINE